MSTSNTMSISAGPPSSTLNPTIAAITTDTVMFTPTVVAAVQTAEALGANATGAEKASAAISAASAALASQSGVNPNVQAIAALVNLSVNIANLLGVFRHKANTT